MRLLLAIVLLVLPLSDGKANVRTSQLGPDKCENLDQVRLAIRQLEQRLHYEYRDYTASQLDDMNRRAVRLRDIHVFCMELYMRPRTSGQGGSR